MTLEIAQNGIVHRHDEGAVMIYRPDKNGKPGAVVEVDEALAERYRLVSGDVVAGKTEPIQYSQEPTVASDECMEDAVAWEEQWDEPAAVRGFSVPSWLVTRGFCSERLVSVESINGLSSEEAEERPFPRRRHPSERAAPDRRLTIATGPNDSTGRILDFAAPLGVGYAGIVYGPHAGGLTRTLRAVVAGATQNASDVITIVLLLRARGEEMTDWRRRFPEADIVVCPAAQSGATAEQTLRIADLTLECALRQTELGRHVLLAVDSLTGLWGAMLEVEAADAQANADQSRARQRIREWIQKAGSFSGEGLLGGNLGGSLTLIGAVWQQAIDLEAEEEREVHPHLRLMEHILHETSWRIPLSEKLATERLYPAIDTVRCISQREENFVSPETYEKLLAARRGLSGLSLLDRYNALMDALDTTQNESELLAALAQTD